jgi:cytochrome b561
VNEPAVAWPLAMRIAHWLSAALVISLLVLGAVMVFAVADPARRFELTQIHKPLGILALALTVARLCFRFGSRAPKIDPASRLVALAAKAAHLALYLLLFLMPLSGWLMVTSTPIRIPVSLFGLLDLPFPLAPDLATYQAARTTHLVLSIALALLLVVHTGAAMVHQFLWRDGTLARMWGAAARRAPAPAVD